jgi:hypothetical protein
MQQYKLCILFCLAVLKMNVDIERFLRNLRDSSKMLSHFLHAWADSRKLIQCPAGLRVWGDPAGALAPRRLPGTPAERERISQKSTLNINTAFSLKEKI